MIVAGIDVGRGGAIALLGEDRAVAFPMPLVGDGLHVRAIKRILEPAGLVVIEKATAMPRQGVVSMFSFGQTYGTLLTIPRLMGIRTEIVTPQAWKKLVLAGMAHDKSSAIAYCARAFPGVSLLPTERSRKPHDGMADALCIAAYGRRAFALGNTSKG